MVPWKTLNNCQCFFFCVLIVGDNSWNGPLYNDHLHQKNNKWNVETGYDLYSAVLALAVAGCSHYIVCDSTNLAQIKLSTHCSVFIPWLFFTNHKMDTANLLTTSPPPPQKKKKPPAKRGLNCLCVRWSTYLPRLYTQPRQKHKLCFYSFLCLAWKGKRERNKKKPSKRPMCLHCQSSLTGWLCWLLGYRDLIGLDPGNRNEVCGT